MIFFTTEAFFKVVGGVKRRSESGRCCLIGRIHVAANELSDSVHLIEAHLALVLARRPHVVNKFLQVGNLLEEIFLGLLQAVDFIVLTGQQTPDGTFATLQVSFPFLKTVTLRLDLTQLLNQVLLLVGLGRKECLVLLQKNA